MDPRTVQNTLVILGALGAVLAVVHTQTHWLDGGETHSLERERCYGVVKEGKNDCGTQAHSCAGLANTDGDSQEWVMVPKGLCNKLHGGIRETE